MFLIILTLREGRKKKKKEKSRTYHAILFKYLATLPLTCTDVHVLSVPQLIYRLHLLFCSYTNNTQHEATKHLQRMKIFGEKVTVAYTSKCKYFSTLAKDLLKRGHKLAQITELLWSKSDLCTN